MDQIYTMLADQLQVAKSRSSYHTQKITHVMYCLNWVGRLNHTTEGPDSYKNHKIMHGNSRLYLFEMFEKPSGSSIYTV